MQRDLVGNGQLSVCGREKAVENLGSSWPCIPLPGTPLEHGKLRATQKVQGRPGARFSHLRRRSLTSSADTPRASWKFRLPTSSTGLRPPHSRNSARQVAGEIGYKKCRGNAVCWTPQWGSISGFSVVAFTTRSLRDESTCKSWHPRRKADFIAYEPMERVQTRRYLTEFITYEPIGRVQTRRC